MSVKLSVCFFFLSLGGFKRKYSKNKLQLKISFFFLLLKNTSAISQKWKWGKVNIYIRLEPAGRGGSQQNLAIRYRTWSKEKNNQKKKNPVASRQNHPSVQAEPWAAGASKTDRNAPATKEAGPIERTQLPANQQEVASSPPLAPKPLQRGAPYSLLTATGQWHTNQFNTPTGRKADGVFHSGDGVGLEHPKTLGTTIWPVTHWDVEPL